MKDAIGPPGKEHPFMFISNHNYCAEIKYFYFNVMGLRISMLHIIRRLYRVSDMLQTFESVLLHRPEFLETTGNFSFFGLCHAR